MLHETGSLFARKDTAGTLLARREDAADSGSRFARKHAAGTFLAKREDAEASSPAVSTACDRVAPVAISDAQEELMPEQLAAEGWPGGGTTACVGASQRV